MFVNANNQNIIFIDTVAVKNNSQRIQKMKWCWEGGQTRQNILFVVSYLEALKDNNQIKDPKRRTPVKHSEWSRLLDCAHDLVLVFYKL